ncbi:type II toxin-antitoxin system VapC family toxin [Neolewinella sp.]|uniref:type II toxin-antitoxin system VapC family toxin n=1 Tax=Neolewinella sp. TaxID=2993543 RepID=UPI003B5275CF
MNYLLDTNIVIIYSRDKDYAKQIETKYQLFGGDHDLYISVVTLGELDALIKKNKLGQRKIDKIEKILSGIATIGIDYDEIISKYGDIDAYSQGKIDRGGQKFAAKNMGKNDLWIAATASHYDLTLLTTDKDFDHLVGEYLDLELIRLNTLTEKK